MAKRFTDTDKWKKRLLKSMPAGYKLLWLYIWDDCDHAGIWHVDIDIACRRIGEEVTEEKAIEIFSEMVYVFDFGAKWFIPDFIEFQYGELSSKNRVHESVLKELSKNNLLNIKPLTSPLQGVKDKDKDKDKDKAKDKDKEEGTFFENSESTEIPLPAKMQSMWINALRGKYVSMPSNDMPVILEVLNFIFEQETGTRKSFCDYAPEETEMILSEWGKWIEWYKENGKQKSLDTIINKFKMMQEIYLQIKNGKHATIKNFSSGSVGKITGASGGLNVIAKVREELLRGRA